MSLALDFDLQLGAVEWLLCDIWRFGLATGEGPIVISLIPCALSTDR